MLYFFPKQLGCSISLIRASWRVFSIVFWSLAPWPAVLMAPWSSEAAKWAVEYPRAAFLRYTSPGFRVTCESSEFSFLENFAIDLFASLVAPSESQMSGSRSRRMSAHQSPRLWRLSHWITVNGSPCRSTCDLSTSARFGIWRRNLRGVILNRRQSSKWWRQVGAL